MNKPMFLSLALIAAVATASLANDKAPPQPKNAASRIIHVTVYPNSALVTREVDVPEGPGPLELVVTPLPPQTVNSSLYTEGTDGIRIMTTRFRSRAIKEDTREEVRKIEDQIKGIETANEKIQSDIKAVESNMMLLTKLETFTASTTASATDKGNLNSDSAIALATYVMKTRAEKAKELVSMQQELKENLEKVKFAKRQLAELSAGGGKTERDAVIVVDKANGGASKVRLNYLVDSASWRPQYKFRAGKDAKDAVLVEYLAGVVQQTGESWENVHVTLSTAQPMLNAAPPDLKMLAVAVVPRGAPGQPGPGGVPMQPPGVVEEQLRNLRNQAQKDWNEKKADKGLAGLNDAAAIEQARDLHLDDLKRIATGKLMEGPSVTFHLANKLSVPSRNDEHVLEISRIEMAPEYCYKAVPILTPHVYRLANLANKSKYVLLPGEATMYEGTDFVGQMSLPLVAIGESFTAGFGVDPQLQVQRQMIDKVRTTSGGNQVFTFEYRILVSSFKADKVKVQVWDRLPHAENETVGVNLVKTTPELCKDGLYLREQRPQNLLRWDIEVEPTQNGEKAYTLSYLFKLEMDKQMTIGAVSSK